MGFNRRTLKRLEKRGPRPCPACGYAPDDYRPMAVIYEDHPEKSFDGDPHERCPRCDRELYVVINVVYDSPAGEEGGGALLD